MASGQCSLGGIPKRLTICLILLSTWELPFLRLVAHTVSQKPASAGLYRSTGIRYIYHLNRINGFNTRSENATSWKEVVYEGDDFMAKMIAQKPGNVVVLSGNNEKKTEYIKAAIDAGLNVLSDKPMCINPQDFELLKEAFASAEKNGLLLYDIMTERHEVNSIIQRELANNPELFGELQKGTPENPAVIKESIHHFFKYVAGNPIKRPPWYFDTTKQGEGVVDVTTHLVDLIAWSCFPEQTIYQKDIELISAKRWPTMVDKAQFEKVTKLSDFPDFLKKNLNDQGVLPCYANGEVIYTIKGITAKTSVEWKFQAPEGTGDTHFSVLRGTKANIFIRQGKEQNYKPEIYVEPAEGADAAALEQALTKAIANLQGKYSGVAINKQKGSWHVAIPDKYRIGHEAHFGQVTEKYLQFLVDGKMPDWEIPNMITKNYITTSALKMAQTKE